jgi:hypothetical protein
MRALHERVLLGCVVQAGGADPAAGEEVGVNRALHGTAVTKPAEEFSDKATRPGLRLEIFRGYIGRLLFRISRDPLPNFFLGCGAWAGIAAVVPHIALYAAGRLLGPMSRCARCAIF